MKFKTKIKRPCGCGANRWKTKGTVPTGDITKYQCRVCGGIRNVTRKEVIDNG